MKLYEGLQAYEKIKRVFSCLTRYNMIGCKTKKHRTCKSKRARETPNQCCTRIDNTCKNSIDNKLKSKFASNTRKCNNNKTKKHYQNTCWPGPAKPSLGWHCEVDAGTHFKTRYLELQWRADSMMALGTSSDCKKRNETRTECTQHKNKKRFES